MTYSNQFKTILWKNWKIFKQRSTVFSICFELFFTFLIIATLSVRDKVEFNFDSNSMTPAVDITHEFASLNENTRDHSFNSIAFILPKNNKGEVDSDTFISYVMNDISLKDATSMKSLKFENEKEFDDYIRNGHLDDIMCGVIFDNESFTNYTIRISSVSIPDPKEKALSDYASTRFSKMIKHYGLSGTEYVEAGIALTDSYNRLFIYIQKAVDNAIIQIKTKGAIKGYSTAIGKLSEPSIYYNPKLKMDLKDNFDGIAPYIIIIVIGQLFHLSNRLMEEKESKTKDGLIAIGANPFILSFTWEIIYFPLSLVLILLVYIFDPCDIIHTLNPILYASVLIFYIIAMYSIVVIVTNLVKRFKTVLVIICLFVSCMITLSEVVYKLKFTGYLKIHRILSAIFPFFGVSMATVEIGHESDYGNYIGFSTMFDSDFGINYIFVACNAAVYFMIALILEYLHGVDFRSIGVRKSEMKSNNTNTNEYAGDIQEDPIGSECFVEVKNIYKYFKFRRNIGTDTDENDKKLGKIFAANNDISFKVYKDEIFAILGHNGAGKSTLIQNMVGLIRPDGGEIYYCGQPLSKNKKEVRRQLGICLQSNVIIEGFTVADHFRLYSGIKGVPHEESDLQQWLEEIDLVQKRDYEVQKMSGGQKRKLCIGLALIGNPKYVFLDEPTTGLDPFSRRKIWNLLLKVKKDRVIFITTHYMDEADIIADRKLIMNRGSIRCLGSSIYLKNHFHMKYDLEVETTQPEAVGRFIQQHIPESEYFDKKNNSYKGEENQFSSKNNIYTWKLPIQASPLFSSLLKDLEKERGHLLNNFSLNSPLLEELFVDLERQMEEKRTGRGINKDEREIDIYDLPKTDNVSRPSVLKTALRLSCYRIKVYLRQPTYFFMGIIVPIGILSFFLPILHKKFDEVTFANYEKRELSSDLFQDQQWNFDLKGSQNLDTVFFNEQLIQQEFPKHSDQSNSVYFLTTEEMDIKGLNISTAPFYVSSISGQYDAKLNTFNFNVHYNESMVHSLPATLNTLSNAILAANHVNDTIHVNSQPLGFFDPKLVNEPKLYTTLVIAFCFAFPLSFFGMNVVRERACKLLKQLQLNGVPNRSYWLSVLFSDYVVFTVTCVLILSTFVIYKFNVLLHASIIVLLLIFTMVCAIAALLFQYSLSYVFKKESNAFLVFFIFNVVPSCAILIKSFLENITADENSGIELYLYLGFLNTFLICLFPIFGLSRMIRTMINVGLEHESINTSISFLNLLDLKNQVYFSFLGELLSIAFYGYILVFITKKTFNPKRGVFEISETMDAEFTKEIENDDDDIYNEYKRLKEDKANAIPIKLIKVVKEYDDIDFTSKQEIVDALNRKNPKYGEFHLSDSGNRHIVMTPFKNINLGVDKHECFGILGPNGSGKSSLLNVTSFTYPQTVGKVYYDGKDTTERQGNEITLGYCPQEDTLWNEYTLFEHIEMFLYLRGHSKKESKRIAKEFINYCRLTEHKNKMPSELSGGTRRKLNILMGICCSSSKIILDEPSAGMDPSTRRYVWDIIRDTLQRSDSSTIMSTHSMEEAEMLCNRIAIMIKGKIRCIGSPEHIKMKYGNTYILDVHTNDIEKFHQEVVLDRDLFGGSDYEREVKSLQRIKYEVKNTTNISRIFEIMESCRESNIFTDYSYSQTSLEQVFLNFAIKGFQEED